MAAARARALTLSGEGERATATATTTTTDADMTPVLYGEIRVILRENEVKTFHTKERVRFSCEKYPEAAWKRRERDRGRGGVLWHHCGMKTAWKQGKKGEGRGERKEESSCCLPTTKNCAVKNAAAAYVFGKVI